MLTALGGKLSEIILVDFRARSACSASRLGNRYMPHALLAHFAKQEKAIRIEQPVVQNQLDHPRPANAATSNEKQVDGPAHDESLLTLLLLPQPSADYLPWELKKRRRKKSKQISQQIH